jgi:hypothetical protein
MNVKVGVKKLKATNIWGWSEYNQLRTSELFLYHQQLTGELKNQV